jgi:hypothetical protein
MSGDNLAIDGTKNFEECKMRNWIGLCVMWMGCGASNSGGGGDTALADSEECGDIDGAGGDSGDVPNILGKWTVQFGEHEYSDVECDVEGLEQEDIRFLQGNMDIKGAPPDGIYAIFDGETSNRYTGLESSTGGVVFAGSEVLGGHTLYVSVGGLLYEEPMVDRDVIRGFGYIGVDKESEDTVIDCWITGDFKAFKSGS